MVGKLKRSASEKRAMLRRQFDEALQKERRTFCVGDVVTVRAKGGKKEALETRRIGVVEEVHEKFVVVKLEKYVESFWYSQVSKPRNRS